MVPQEAAAELTHAKTPSHSYRLSIPAIRQWPAQPSPAGPAFRMRIPAGPSENTTPITGLVSPLGDSTPLIGVVFFAHLAAWVGHGSNENS